jgi:NAD(P)-dependent dehydrogenase (short-subunit alcohol dehydrogenase family)
MKIVVVGAGGVIGRAVCEALGSLGSIIRVGRSSGDIRIDATSIRDIQRLYELVGTFDHLISLIGVGVPMGALSALPPEAFGMGFANKVEPQIMLVKLGQQHVRDGGSFTLSAGHLSKEPLPGFPAVAMANGAIEAFVRSAALDLARGVRINSVSPLFVIESLQAAGFTDSAGLPTMSAADTALAYRASVLGSCTGRDLDPRKFFAS